MIRRVQGGLPSISADPSFHGSCPVLAPYPDRATVRWGASIDFRGWRRRSPRRPPAMWDWCDGRTWRLSASAPAGRTDHPASIAWRSPSPVVRFSSGNFPIREIRRSGNLLPSRASQRRKAFSCERLRGVDGDETAFRAIPPTSAPLPPPAAARQAARIARRRVRARLRLGIQLRQAQLVVCRTAAAQHPTHWPMYPSFGIWASARAVLAPLSLQGALVRPASSPLPPWEVPHRARTPTGSNGPMALDRSCFP